MDATYLREMAELTRAFAGAFGRVHRFAWKQGRRGGRYWLPDGKPDQPANRLYGAKAESAARAAGGRGGEDVPRGGPKPGEEEKVARAKFEVARDAHAAAVRQKLPPDRVEWLRKRMRAAQQELQAKAPKPAPAKPATPPPAPPAAPAGRPPRVPEMPGWLAAHPGAAGVYDLYAKSTGRTRSVFETALHNAGVISTDGGAARAEAEEPEDYAGYSFRERLGRQLAIGYRDQHALGHTAAERAAVEKALRAIGARPVGRPGEAVPFDGSLHDAFPGAFTDTPARVVRPGWVMGRGGGSQFVLVKASTERAPVPPPPPVPTRKPVGPAPPRGTTGAGVPKPQGGDAVGKTTGADVAGVVGRVNGVLADRQKTVAEVRAALAELDSLSRDELERVAQGVGLDYVKGPRWTKPKILARIRKTTEGVKLDQHRSDRITGTPNKANSPAPGGTPAEQRATEAMARAEIGTPAYEAAKTRYVKARKAAKSPPAPPAAEGFRPLGWLRDKYKKLEGRYGRAGAALTVAGMALPIPGTAVAAPLAAEAVLRTRRALGFGEHV